MKVKKIDGEDVEAAEIDVRESWVVARVEDARRSNSRLIPRENIAEVVVADDEDWSRVSGLPQR